MKILNNLLISTYNILNSTFTPNHLQSNNKLLFMNICVNIATKEIFFPNISWSRNIITLPLVMKLTVVMLFFVFKEIASNSNAHAHGIQNNQLKMQNSAFKKSYKNKATKWKFNVNHLRFILTNLFKNNPKKE